MSTFTCPVSGCKKELSRLQVMHFRAAHDCDPVEWVKEQHGSELEKTYSAGKGSYAVATEYEWLTPDMVCEIIETRTHPEAMGGRTNPMKRDEVSVQFQGDNNPAKRPEVREKISEAVTGHTMSKEAREKISRKNRGNKISETQREAISQASSKRDTSYMQTEAYSKALSDSLKGREPTYPTPYSVDELSHDVRSSWEEEVATLLVENDIPYTYETEFELSVGSYYPDFVLTTDVVEVKGFSNERSVKKATAFLNEFPGYRYVVVGDEIPCDVHIPWEQRAELLEVLNDV